MGRSARRLTRLGPLPASLLPSPFPPYAWQVKALDEWDNNERRGIIEAATGTGKTALALEAIRRLHQSIGDSLRVAVAVPSLVLAAQWRREAESLGLRESEIGDLHSQAEWRWAGQPVAITVLNTAKYELPEVLAIWAERGLKSLLVVDECHRVATPANSKLFDVPATYRLGLSATPEREDGGHRKYLRRGIGPVVYRYPLLQALDDGILSPVRSIILYIDLTDTERSEFAQLTKEIGVLLNLLLRSYPDWLAAGVEIMTMLNNIADRDFNARKLLRVLADRRSLLSNASARGSCVDAIIGAYAPSMPRTILFHEQIRAAERTFSLVSRHAPAALEHSKLPPDLRAAAFADFRSGAVPVLVAVKALDEGVNVPEAAVAVIVEGSRSRRQRIQRVGRILRRSGNPAVVWSILVRGTIEEPAVGARDEQLFGPERVFHHLWPETSISDALTSDVSTFAPKAPSYSPEEILALTDLGLGAELPTPDVTSLETAGGYLRSRAIASALGVPYGDFTAALRAARADEPYRYPDAYTEHLYDRIHRSELEDVKRRLELDDA